MTSAEPRSHTYRISTTEPWISVDPGTLRLPAAPKGGESSAELSVRLAPSVLSQPGLHSGVVRFDDPTTDDPADHEMLVTVVSGYPLAAMNGDSLHVTGSGDQGIEAAAYRSVFVATAGLRAITITSATPADSPAGIDVYVPDRNGLLLNAPPFRQTLPDPGPGNQASITIPITGEFDMPVLEIAMLAMRSTRKPARPTTPGQSCLTTPTT